MTMQMYSQICNNQPTDDSCDKMSHNTDMKSTDKIIHTPTTIMTVPLSSMYTKKDYITNDTDNMNKKDNDNNNSTRKLTNYE